MPVEIDMRDRQAHLGRGIGAGRSRRSGSAPRPPARARRAARARSVVLPAPRSPDSATTSPARSSGAERRAGRLAWRRHRARIIAACTRVSSLAAAGGSITVGALARLGQQRQRAAMRLDELAGQRQAEPGGGRRSAARPMPRSKRANTCAAIAGGMPGPLSETTICAASASPVGVEQHAAARRRIGDRVAQQMVDRLAQPPRDRRRSLPTDAIDLDRELESARLRRASRDRRGRLARERGEIDRLVAPSAGCPPRLCVRSSTSSISAPSRATDSRIAAT